MELVGREEVVGVRRRDRCATIIQRGSRAISGARRAFEVARVAVEGRAQRLGQKPENSPKTGSDDIRMSASGIAVAERVEDAARSRANASVAARVDRVVRADA